MPYLGRGPDFGVRSVFHFLASDGDTSVSGADADGKNLSFADGNFIDVYLNGVRLKSGEDYNTGTANTVAGLSALNANDEVNVVVYDTFTVADTVQASTGGTFSGDVTTTGTFNVTGDTAAGDDASIGFTSAEGLILTGQGTTNDVTIKNDADTAVIQIPTGTDDVNFTDDISLKSDGAVINFGTDSEITVTHVADTGLNIKHTATGDDKPIKITLQTGETDIAADDVLGAIDFQAPDEGTGTDAILVAAGIEAVSEGDFSSSSNATKLSFKTASSAAAAETMSLSSGGNLAVTGSITANSASTINVTGGSALTLKSTDAGATAAPVLFLQRDSASPADSDICGRLMFRADNDAGEEHDFIKVESVVDDVSDGSEGGSLRFFSSTNGTLAERMRINSNGHLIIGSADFSNNLSNTNSHEKIILENDGEFKMQGAAKAIATFNRNQTDGTVILIQQENTSEGSIAVSGTTVSFDGFAGRHESSGIPTDTEKGTVVSTIDELDVYPAKQGNGKKEEDCPRAGQTRADHAKVKISDTVGDKRVYGVVDTYTAQDKLMVASVGIASVKVTGACEGGDLLESNGDGTAKVQSDDIIRSKTIGKVTIGNSNVGVKLVSCVLYCG